MLYYGIILYFLLLQQLITCSNVTEPISSSQDPLIEESNGKSFREQFVQSKNEFKFSSNNTIEPSNRNIELWNADQFLQIWNPIVISRIWKNETCRDADISLPCGKDLTRYMMGILRKTNWALKMMDADGKYIWGIFSGNKYWVGAADQCRKMEKEFIEWQQDKKLHRNKELPPFRVSMNSINLTLEILKPGLNETHNIILGLCLPIVCDTKDVERLLYFAQNQSSVNLPLRFTIDHIRNLSKGYTFWKDTTFYILLISFVLVCVLVLMGTFYDVALRYKILLKANKRSNNNITITGLKSLRCDGNFDRRITLSKLWSMTRHNGSLDVHNSKIVPKPLSEALLSFSLLVNMSKLCSFNVGKDTLAPIHGLRFYTMLWIILLHTCLFFNDVSDREMFRTVAEENFLYQTIGNGTYSVDTFFFMSGCLVAFLYYRTMANEKIRDKKMIKGCHGQVLQFLGMIWYRYFRLTPVYLFMIGLLQVSMKWYHDHSMIELSRNLNYKTCENVWWKNALYINTYFDFNDRCMTWSWYLANDTQFYTVGIIILIIGASFLPVAAFIGAFLLIASWITTALITLNTNHVPSIQDPFAHYESLYDKPWIRIGPYLIGMVTGWYLFKIDCKANMNKAVIVIGWSISLITMASIVYGLHGTTFGPILSAIYMALSHSGWAICLAWILIACVTGYGGIVTHILSWKYLYPISRLTYCNYLVHSALLHTIALDVGSSWHFTYSSMALLFFGIVVVSYASSLFLSLFFEAPVVSLLRILHPMREWKIN
ncbi:O-acyltransferase like protein-like [Camponotus floridanus]|uniref:O-acyltransferase like protein-like n=1 Tax=Camponotus floridanus TaxID=104421 RepID=UPI000DC66A42|nr:O-acyltransferase like protein-like [Camponotus floridanus]